MTVVLIVLAAAFLLLLAVGLCRAATDRVLDLDAIEAQDRLMHAEARNILEGRR